MIDNASFVQAGSLAIKELARSSMRRIDACRCPHGPGLPAWQLRDRV